MSKSARIQFMPKRPALARRSIIAIAVLALALNGCTSPEQLSSAPAYTPLRQYQALTSAQLQAAAPTAPEQTALNWQAEQGQELALEATQASSKLSALLSNYQQLLAMSEDQALRGQWQARIAELQLQLNELEQEQGVAVATNQGYFVNSISQLQALISDPSQQTADLYYQLAKAYELQGQRQQSYQTLIQLVQLFPASPYVQESYFRQGEYLFSLADYPSAALAYQQVVALSHDNAFYPPALYMLAWAQYKQERYADALTAFGLLLEHSLTDLPGHDLQQLPVTERKWLQDSFRMMSLLFAYQQGPASVQAFYRHSPAPYSYLSFQALADYYLQQGRFQDAAESYGAFIALLPEHEKAPEFAIQQLVTYQQGDFPSLVTKMKQQFVADYQLAGHKRSALAAAQQQFVAPYLRQFISEQTLTAYQQAQNHKTVADYQTAATALARWLAHAEQGAFGEDWLQSEAAQREYLQQYWLRAESYYASQQFALAVADYQLLAYGPMRMLAQQASAEQANESQPALTSNTGSAQPALSEPRAATDNGEIATASYSSAPTVTGLHPLSVALQSQYAWRQWQTPTQRNEAGYSALLAQRQLTPARDLVLNDEVIALSEMYVAHYAENPRANVVLVNLAQHYFAISDHENAVAWAEQGLQQAGLSVSQQQQLWLVKAQSAEQQQQLAAAEQGYRQLWQLLPAQDPQRHAMAEHIAAMQYQQAQALWQQAPEQAAAALQGLIREWPNSAVRQTAHYELAQRYLAAQDWQAASTWLTSYQQQYPQDPRSKEIPLQLAQVYEQAEDWSKAAAAYANLLAATGDPELQRKALWQSAELYWRAEQWSAARDQYRRYAHQYSKPLTNSLLAMQQLAAYYQRSNEPQNVYFWQQKLVNTEARAGSERSAETKLLAAKLQLQLAEQAKAQFMGIKLRLPLAKSLALKKRYLDEASNGFKRSLQYGFTEINTAATLHMAQLFQQFAKDLMQSERPKDLDELALEQYDVLLEEQAFPFEEQAIALYQQNTALTAQGHYDANIKASFTALATLLPARYQKAEQVPGLPEVNYVIH